MKHFTCISKRTHHPAYAQSFRDLQAVVGLVSAIVGLLNGLSMLAKDACATLSDTSVVASKVVLSFTICL